jgi:hypothetical protein
MKSLSDPAIRQFVIERIQRLSASTPRKWGRMTAHQMICHLNDSYKVATGEKIAGSKSGLFQRTVMKWVALWTPLEWPKGVQTMAEVEQGVGGTCPSEFQLDRDELLSIVDDFCTRDCDTFAAGHPIFGPMKHDDWMRWGYLHADHHLRQFGM